MADEETFRCLAACKKAIHKGGLGPCAANGANEEAVALFLQDKIGFLDIGRPVPEKIQGALTIAAFALLFGLMLFATYNDIIRLLSGAL